MNKMGAQHGYGLGSKIQLVGEDTVGLRRNATKINVVQPPAGPHIHNVSGRGVGATGTIYPINPIIDDRGTVSDASIDVVIPDPRHHYTKMSLNNANPTINLIDLIVGLSTTFTLDLTNAIALSSLTFSPALVNAPTLNLGNGQRNVLTIVGHRTTSETRYEVINGTGGGVSFPIIPPVDVRGNVSTAQNINLSLTTAHVTTMTLTANISITFSIFPATANQIEWEVEIKQDGSGNRTVTWPPAVTPTPVLDSAANATTIVVLRTNDNGTIIRTLTNTGGAGDASLWANFPAVADVDFATFDGVNIDRLLFDQASGSALSAGQTGFTSNAGSELIANVPVASEYFWQIGAVTKMSLQEIGADPFLILIGDSTDIPKFRLLQDKGSAPTIGTRVGEIQFYGVDTGGSTQVQYANITVDYEDATIGSADGSMNINVQIAGSPVTFMALNNAQSNFISFGRNLFMGTGIDIEMRGNDIIFDTGDLTRIFGTGSGMSLQVNGTTQVIVNDGSVVLQTNVALTNARFLALLPNTVVLTSNGQFHYDSSVNKFRAFENGAEVDMISAGAQTPWVADIDADGFDLTDLSNIEFRSTTGAPAGTVAYINWDTSDMIFNVPTADDFQFKVNNVNKILISNVGIFPATDGALNIGSAGLSWDSIFLEAVKFEIGGSITSANRIISDSGGMVYMALSTGSHGFFMNGVERFQIQEDGTLHWVQSGRQHDIIPQTTSLDLVAELVSDSLKIFTGSARTNETVKVETLKTTFFTENNNVGAYVLQLVQNNNTPAAFRTLANIDFIAENSLSVDHIYARISASSQVITDPVEDGLLQLGIISGGTLITAIDMEGSGSSGANDAKIGFFGVTPVVQQTLVASPTTTQISTALRNLGLTKL